MTKSDPVEAAFSQIYGLPCWNVKPGHGSFLTLEFGQPHLEVREPREAAQARSAKLKRLYARRRVILQGDWHLWIYCCYWDFFQRDELVGDSKSKKGILKTVREMDGQKLERVSVNHLLGHSVFEFDLGGRLTTRPFDQTHEEPREQWFLFEPSGNVLAYRADGMVSHQPKDTRPEQEEWRPLAALPAT